MGRKHFRKNQPVESETQLSMHCHVGTPTEETLLFPIAEKEGEHQFEASLQ